MSELTQNVIDFLMSEDSCAVGIATLETLAGGPPTADITSVLPEAKSAVSFAVPMDQSLILPYLGKKERRPYQHEHIHVHALTSGMALALSRYLEQRGYPSYPLASNNVYRPDASPGGSFDLIPDISLRYLAVASGVIGIAENRMSFVHEVDANLVGSSGVKLQREQAEIVELLQLSPICSRQLSIRLDGKFLPVMRITPDRLIDHPPAGRHPPPGDRIILAVNIPVSERLCQPRQRRFTLAYDHHTGSVLIESVNKSGTVRIVR